MKNIREDIRYDYLPQNIFVIEYLAAKLCNDICNKIDNNIGTNIRGQIYNSIRVQIYKERFKMTLENK